MDTAQNCAIETAQMEQYDIKQLRWKFWTLGDKKPVWPKRLNIL